MLNNKKGTMLQRFTTGMDYSSLNSVRPEKTLTKILPKKAGRNATGKITARHDGGRQKRYYRTIDFKRDKYNLPGKVVSVEYDPNRSSNIALLQYSDGEKRYIIHPEGLEVGALVISGKDVEAKLGNNLPLVRMPVGTVVHNVELTKGSGGQIVRGAGTGAVILAKEGEYVTIKLPSSETRLVHKDNFATVGVVDNGDWKNMVWGSAGRQRHMGHRPEVRGTAQNPRTHPHGGGEGRSGVGLKQSKTPWGKPARGLKTRIKNKYSDKFVVNRRG